MKATWQKRIAAWIIAAAMTLSMAAAPALAEEATLSDVAEAQQAVSEIETLSDEAGASNAENEAANTDPSAVPVENYGAAVPESDPNIAPDDQAEYVPEYDAYEGMTAAGNGEYRSNPLPVRVEEEASDTANAGLVAYNGGAQVSTGYCYGLLNDSLKTVYRACGQAVQDLVNRPIISLPKDAAVSQEDFLIARDAYMYDHPEDFLMGDVWSFQAQKQADGSLRVIGVGMWSGGYSSSAAWQQTVAAFNAKVDALLAKVDRSKDDASIALQLHDILADNITYDPNWQSNTDYSTHSVYGAIVNGVAVCDGYSKAYQYLLGKCGITATIIESAALNHAWNLVQLGGDWYETDLTWDDSNGRSYTYYNLTTSGMNGQHGGARNGSGLCASMATANGTQYSYAAMQKNNQVVSTGKSGTTNSATGVEGFVTRLYSVCLGRTPDTTGLNNWMGVLTSRQQSGRDVAYGFVFSAEFTNKNYNNTDFVKQLYRAFMGREYDQGGLNGWVGALDSGSMSRVQVFDGFAYSAEFGNICTSYGINRG